MTFFCVASNNVENYSVCKLVAFADVHEQALIHTEYEGPQHSPFSILSRPDQDR